ncbi:MAG: sugar transferase [Candidatus Eremiobacteraeota bacterium]|nr:sugar transferase [Candidatus Eremiobacteraeota bacterium]
MIKLDSLVFRDAVPYRLARRTFDLIASSILLLLVSPILALACLAIYIDDPGPVLFVQTRIGRFNRPFRIYKLRTMRMANCVDAPSPTGARDPRITRVGHWLRKSSIDELPQLFNVIRAEMALVGPRPEMPFIVKKYENWQQLRHLVTPGITCLWQTECRSTIPLDRPEATIMDVEYIRNASIAYDAKILARTVSAVISSKGSY